MSLIKSKLVYVFMSLTIFFLLLGGITVALIDKKVQKNHTQMLEKMIGEKALLINKELESIDRSLGFISQLAEEGQFAAIDRLLLDQQPYDFVLGYSYFKNKEQDRRYFLKAESAKKDSLKTIIGVLEQNEGKYYKMGDEWLTFLDYPTKKGHLRTYISLKALNGHLQNESLGRYAYLEIFDREGVCITSPEFVRIGTIDQEVSGHFANVTDTLLQSDYLKLQVLQQRSMLKGTFKNYKMFVSIPSLLIGDNVIEIRDLIWLLWGIGIAAALISLLFIIKQSRKQVDLQTRNLKYQNEKAIYELSNLKQKMNPHFLFNTLGTLQQLIGKDASLSKKFVTKLAKVYRKLLNVPESGISTLKAELDLLEEYVFLQQLRFGVALEPIQFHINEMLLDRKLPNLSLQLLVENAIKHNEITIDHPLSIEITVSETGVEVKNRKYLRKGPVDSEGYGTRFLSKIYEYYKVPVLSVKETDEWYVVFLPFIA